MSERNARLGPMSERDARLVDKLAAAARAQSAKIDAAAARIQATRGADSASPEADADDVREVAAALAELASTGAAEREERLLRVAHAGFGADQLAQRRARKPAVAAAALGLAAAAGIALLVRPAAPALPPYQVAWQGGLSAASEGSTRRRAGAAAPGEQGAGDAIRLTPDAELIVTLTPELAAGSAVVAQALLEVDGALGPADMTIQVSEAGAVRAAGRPARRLDRARPRAVLWLVVRRQGTSPPAAEIVRASADRGPSWQRVRLDLEVLGPR